MKRVWGEISAGVTVSVHPWVCCNLGLWVCWLQLLFCPSQHHLHHLPCPDSDPTPACPPSCICTFPLCRHCRVLKPSRLGRARPRPCRRRWHKLVCRTACLLHRPPPPPQPLLLPPLHPRLHPRPPPRPRLSPLSLSLGPPLRGREARGMKAPGSHGG